MVLNKKLFDLFAHKANQVMVECLCIGLGYTSVITEDGGMGVAYTLPDKKISCSIMDDHYDFEGKPAVQLLEWINQPDSVKRSAALALINALNYDHAFSLPEDRGNTALFERFSIDQGTKVAMTGFFPPLVKLFQKKNIPLEIIDAGRGIGNKKDFYNKLKTWADVLILSSTSILNNTTEEILNNVGPRGKTVMLGPSTPMVPEAFDHLPVHMLAGTVMLDKKNALKAVRHGAGTPILKKYGRKICIKMKFAG